MPSVRSPSSMYSTAAVTSKANMGWRNMSARRRHTERWVACSISLVPSCASRVAAWAVVRPCVVLW